MEGARKIQVVERQKTAEEDQPEASSVEEADIQHWDSHPRRTRHRGWRVERALQVQAQLCLEERKDSAQEPGFPKKSVEGAGRYWVATSVEQSFLRQAAEMPWEQHPFS